MNADVSPQPDTGSAAIPAPQLSAVPAGVSQAPLAGQNVVVADDREPVGRALVRLCRALGADAAFVQHQGQSAEDFSKQILERSPETVLLDGELSGGVSGLDVLQILRSEAPQVRVIGASAREDFAGAFISGGAAGFLIKPFGAADLIDAFKAR